MSLPKESGTATAERRNDAGIDRGGIGGHPKGLTTLFFTEMWERFSYYGMRALLILFMTDSVRGGLGFSVARAGRIYGLYTASVYIASLPGGWIADHFLGLRRAVLLGGIAIAIGQFSLAIPNTTTFYAGLLLIVIGTGLLKPNISAMVGELYTEGDPRRDGGFSIYYMGINLGAFFSPLVCGTLGERLGWHWGFAMGGVGMVFGILQYVLTGSRLGSAGLRAKKTDGPAEAGGSRSSLGNLLWLGGFGLIVLALVMPQFGSLQRFVLLALGASLFVSSLYMGGRFTPAERKRGVVIYLLFWIAALFWSTFEQAGSSLNLFAERMTRTTLFGFDFPVTWFQSLNPLYIILLAPVFSWLWIRLGRLEPSGPAKFTFGLLLVGVGFLPVTYAAYLARGGENLVSPMWLVITYFVHTLGELCLSPVGLSLMTKLAPARIVGQIMGVWFLASAIGNYIGGEIASLFEAFPLPQLFGTVAITNIAIALLFALAVPRVRKLMGGVR
jgi:POT family proton-dependent oligopeptide transporter